MSNFIQQWNIAKSNELMFEHFSDKQQDVVISLVMRNDGFTVDTVLEFRSGEVQIHSLEFFDEFVRQNALGTEYKLVSKRK